MRRRTASRALPILLAVSCVLAVAAAGCAAHRSVSTSSAGTAGAAAPHAVDMKGPRDAKGKVPVEFEITSRLSQGMSWKSRFASTSEMKRTFRDAAGKESVKTRAVGLELRAVQTVASLDGVRARIEVTESSAKILQDGKYIDAPFRQFNPPNPVAFTLDTATGKADFTEMEKAYADWMAGVKEGPAGEIVGKTFRLEAYVAQLKDLYAKPFNRFAGKKLTNEPRLSGAKEFALPFLGPGEELPPVPVETTSWYESMEAKGGAHYLKVAGTYGGKMEISAGELAARLADFGVAAPAAFRSEGEARGKFDSAVDILSGREIRSASQGTYSSSASFEGGTFTEEISGKSTLEPAD